MFFNANNNRSKQYELQITPYIDYLYNLAYRLCRNRDDAEDITQDLLVKLYKQFDKWSTAPNPRPYFSRALYNQFIDNLRKQNKHKDIVDIEIDDELPSENSSDTNPEKATDSSIDLDRISMALDKLPTEHRSIIVLHDIEGFTYKEISVTMQIPTGTVKSRHSRARRSLNKLL